jgi:toxin FitB
LPILRSGKGKFVKINHYLSERYDLDSNIVIYAVSPKYEELRNFLKKHEYELAVSAITKLEVLGYHQLKPNEKEILTKFFESVRQLAVNQEVIDKAVKLRQEEKMSMGDSIIASTALLEDDTLLTNNEADFKKIIGLKLLAMKDITG